MGSSSIFTIYRYFSSVPVREEVNDPGEFFCWGKWVPGTEIKECGSQEKKRLGKFRECAHKDESLCVERRPDSWVSGGD